MAKIALPLAAVIAVVALLPGWMRPAVARARIRTATVQTGPIEAVITASGTIVPEIERVLSSPVDARLLRVLKRAGEAVQQGEPVAELDLGESKLALERIASNLAITDNKQAQVRLTLERSLSELRSRIERKELEVEILETKASATARLFAEGLASQQGRDDARLAARQAAIELAQLRRERDEAERSTALQSDGLSLERDALNNEAVAARRTLDLATTRSDRNGILTWIAAQEGALVRRGEVIARIADLSSFRVDASVSDIHSNRIREGMPVTVTLNTAMLAGRISGVQPSVENDVIRFTVTLDERSHPALRPNMRADVHVITDRKPRARIVTVGPFAGGSERADVFVIHGRRAVRTAVQFGLRGADDIEILSGIDDGDEVVISDMRDYLHLTEMEVR